MAAAVTLTLIRARCRVTAGGCWTWQGAQRGAGYACITRGGRKFYVHRLALELKLGRRLEPGEEAHHTCETKLCCNPAHLEVKASHAEHLAEHRHTECARGHDLTAPGSRRAGRDCKRCHADRMRAWRARRKERDGA